MKTDSLLIKAAMIAVMVLLLLIPVSWIKSLVNDRAEMRQAVRTQTIQKWGGVQTVFAPVLVIPYKDASGSKTYLYCLPEYLSIKGTVEPQQISEGIIKIPCYQSELFFSGTFNLQEVKTKIVSENSINWDESYIVLGISSLEGVKNNLSVNVNGKPISASIGGLTKDIAETGFTINTPLGVIDKNELMSFDFNLNLSGADTLNFVPVGKQTDINILAKSEKVLGIGETFPTIQADDNGTSLDWKIYEYNRLYKQMYASDVDVINKTSVGVSFVPPIDHYEKTMRSVKYAIMFLALTFLAFFMTELLGSAKIHPIQYLLVSFALVLFYSLLLAFSEHIGFDWAYFVSSMAIVALITLYSKSVFKNRKQTIAIGSLLVLLYSFLYVVLQMEEKALLLGSVGLFFILAAVMYSSRKIDWYKDISVKD